MKIVKIDCKEINRLRETSYTREGGRERERYVREICGEKYNEKAYIAMCQRNIVWDIIEPIPEKENFKQIRYVVCLLTVIPEKTWWDIQSGDFRTHDGKSFETAFLVELV